MPEEVRLFLIAQLFVVVGAAVKVSVAWLQSLQKRIERGDDGLR